MKGVGNKGKHVFEMSAVREYCARCQKTQDDPIHRKRRIAPGKMPHCVRCGDTYEHPLHRLSPGVLPHAHPYVPALDRGCSHSLRAVVEPDTPESRWWVARTLGWSWGPPTGTGARTVVPGVSWPPGLVATMWLTLPGTQSTIRLKLEWPQ